MVTFKKFDEIIEKIKEFSDFEDTMSEYGIDICYTAASDIADEIVKLLALLINDKEGWISWYCWEVDFGRKDKGGLNIIEVNGKKYKIDSTKKLWDLIKQDANQKKIVMLKNFLIDQDTVLKTGNIYNVEEMMDSLITIYVNGRYISINKNEEDYIFTLYNEVKE